MAKSAKHPRIHLVRWSFSDASSAVTRYMTGGWNQASVTDQPASNPQQHLHVLVAHDSVTDPSLRAIRNEPLIEGVKIVSVTDPSLRAIRNPWGWRERLYPECN